MQYLTLPNADSSHAFAVLVPDEQILTLPMPDAGSRHVSLVSILDRWLLTQQDGSM